MLYSGKLPKRPHKIPITNNKRVMMFLDVDLYTYTITISNTSYVTNTLYVLFPDMTSKNMATAHSLSGGRGKQPSIWGRWVQSGTPTPSVYFPTGNPLEDRSELRELKKKGTSLDNRWEEFIKLEGWKYICPVISRKAAEERARQEEHCP